MKSFDRRNIHLWTQQLLDWLDGKFTAVARSIDFTTVNNKIDAVGGKVDTVGGKVDTVSGKIDNIHIDTSDLAKQGSNANATLTAILEALTGGDEPSPDIPEGVAERLAMILEHFGIKTISGYEFMTDTEVCDELEDIMRVIDPNLTAEQAAAITAQTLNPSES